MQQGEVLPSMHGSQPASLPARQLLQRLQLEARTPGDSLPLFGGASVPTLAQYAINTPLLAPAARRYLLLREWLLPGVAVYGAVCSASEAWHWVPPDLWGINLLSLLLRATGLDYLLLMPLLLQVGVLTGGRDGTGRGGRNRGIRVSTNPAGAVGA